MPCSPAVRQLALPSYTGGVARKPQRRMELANVFILFLAVCAAALGISALVGKRSHRHDDRRR
jgi:hypothetical protein